MNNNSFSRFRNIKTPLHMIDPITKLICFLIITITMFVAQTPEELIVVFIFVMFFSLFGRIRFKSYLLTLLIVLPFFITMMIMYAIVPPYDKFIDELILCLTLTERLYLFILIAIIYTSTTKEMEIANSIEWLISPLRFIKVPIYEISIMIMLAIRFIPLLLEDLSKIMIAQTSRGVNVIHGNLKIKIKGVYNSLLPLFVISLKRSDDIANVMTIRGYEIGQKRSKYYKSKFSFIEIISLLMVLSLLTIIILMETGILNGVWF